MSVHLRGESWGMGRIAAFQPLHLRNRRHLRTKPIGPKFHSLETPASRARFALLLVDADLAVFEFAAELGVEALLGK